MMMQILHNTHNLPGTFCICKKFALHFPMLVLHIVLAERKVGKRINYQTPKSQQFLLTERNSANSQNMNYFIFLTRGCNL
jgi:hypothetical protein